jgi:hypothetical protein
MKVLTSLRGEGARPSSEEARIRIAVDAKEVWFSGTHSDM